ncbi:hypothetical protein LCGC14_0688400 [marine sediment metagenome]|uniref:Uncharacterized protein n=1 Tax=marine sediment metagenome TaxID=412755 RepID=A0A0F9QL60_9ZZZZ
MKIKIDDKQKRKTTKKILIKFCGVLIIWVGYALIPLFHLSLF